MGTGALIWRRVVAMAMVPALLGMTVAASGAQEGTPTADVFGDDGVLTNCVDPSFPPMEYFESQEAQQPIGFDIDLVNAIGERLGVEVVHIPTDFTGLLPALDAGRCDVVASGIYLTADHWESFEAFERFQAAQGEQYRRLDAELEGLALAETFLGAFDQVD